MKCDQLHLNAPLKCLHRNHITSKYEEIKGNIAYRECNLKPDQTVKCYVTAYNDENLSSTLSAAGRTKCGSKYLVLNLHLYYMVRNTILSEGNILLFVSFVQKIACGMLFG